jgi:hypothetical protein
LTVNDVDDVTLGLVPATAPNMTLVEFVTNPVPVTVTVLPPTVAPLGGLTAVTVGSGSYTNTPDAPVTDVPPGVVTATLTEPAGSGGLVTLNDAPVTPVTPVAAVAPNATPAPATKAVPLTVTLVPPEVGPAAGLNPVTVGIAS